MYKMYYVKDKIHKFYSTTAESCLKCKTNNDSIIHAFWECNKVGCQKCYNANVHLEMSLFFKEKLFFLPLK